jgi:transcriptional regulator with XRE-family HTH domain
VNEAKTEIAAAFGRALREARAAANLSQEALALESGVDRTFVSMLERGIRQPALSTVFALSTVLSTKPGVLVDRAEVANRRHQL